MMGTQQNRETSGIERELLDNPFHSTGVVVSRDGHPRPSFASHCGSCFSLFHREWFVTAKHVVQDVPPDHLGIALYIEDLIATDVGWDVAEVHLHDSLDLAVLYLPDWGFEVFDPFIGITPRADLGDPIRCFGYPSQAIPDGAPLVPRMLRGYVQRHFFHESPLGSEYVAYELSMAASAGLSGAPVSLDSDPSNVIGVVSENFESQALLHQIREVEEDGRVFREEIHSVVNHGIVIDLAQHEEWLRDTIRIDA